MKNLTVAGALAKIQTVQHSVSHHCYRPSDFSYELLLIWISDQEAKGHNVKAKVIFTNLKASLYCY
jgi:hypothetical protein